MSNKKLTFILISQLSFLSWCSQAGTAKANLIHHPLYVGIIGGYGSTTWEGLVPQTQNQNLALSMSTPIGATEGGSTWGLLAGYEFTPLFAVEAAYMKYQTASVSFDTGSLFSFNNDYRTEFSTDTETLSLMAKIMLLIPKTNFRIFSSAGAADVHRSDLLTDQWHMGPTFGLGLNYQLNEHFMGELGANYTAGFGESQLNPTDSYIPFLYSIALHLAYKF